MLFKTLLLLLALQKSCCFPDGAPNKHSVCKTLHPHHKHARSQTSPSPYAIVGKKKIPCGTAVNITISAEPGESYKGFIMQARSASDHRKLLGTFTITDPLHSKTINCHGLYNNTVTHSSSVLKTSTSFVWTPPPNYKGDVIFKATVVKDFSTFWTNVTEKVEMSCSEGKNYADLKDETEERDHVTYSEDDYKETESPSVSVYSECGVTKLCFGVPDDCFSTRSCAAIVTVTSKQSKYEFEMLGIEYVGMGFSENGDLNIDSVTECVLMNDADVKFYESRKVFSLGYYHRTQNPRKDIQLVNSTYWDGLVYCKFVRDQEVNGKGMHINYRMNKYFIFLSSTNCCAANREIQVTDSVILNISHQNYYFHQVTDVSPTTQIVRVVQRSNNDLQFMRDFLLFFFPFIFMFIAL